MSKFKQYAVAISVMLLSTSVYAKESSIPQMQPASFPNQLAWLAISFVLLYFLVASFIAPRAASIFTMRENAINDAITKAEELKATATNTRGDFESAGTEARAKAAATIGEVQALVAKQAAEAQAKLAGELEVSNNAAKQRIAKALATAQGNVEEAATSLAQAMTEKLLGTKVAAADVKSAVAQAKKA